MLAAIGEFGLKALVLIDAFELALNILFGALANLTRGNQIAIQLGLGKICDAKLVELILRNEVLELASGKVGRGLHEMNGHMCIGIVG